MNVMSPSLNEQSITSIDTAALTPAMRQYQQYKTQYPDAILFFRIGDFYETFYEDARVISRVLGVALTSRSKGENAVPMAGVPYHAVDGYLQRMIAAGYRVAICEQMQDPKQAAGLIDRQVTRLVTPGTLTEETMLDGRAENFIACLIPLSGREAEQALRQSPGRETADSNSGESPDNQRGSAVENAPEIAALAWCELSTGKFLTLVDRLAACREELARIRPRELLYSEPPDHQPPAWARSLKDMLQLTLTSRPAWQFGQHQAASQLKQQYGVIGFEAFGYTSAADPAIMAAGGLGAYLHETQKASLEHLQPPRPFLRDDYLVIDPASLRSLEVERTIRSNNVEGSLVGSLDVSRTPMGSRLIRNWLLFPLRDPAAIETRLAAVSDLIASDAVLDQLRLICTDCGDIERIAARICCRRATPRDLLTLARSLDTLPVVIKLLKSTGPAAGLAPLTAALESAGVRAGELAGAVNRTIAEDPPSHLRDGNVIRAGMNPELDRLRTLAGDSRTWLADYQAKLCKASGIHSLKVGFNKVFGYYIEVSHAQQSKVPPEFIRRQTVKSAERYITEELKKFEAEVLTAQERSRALEQEIFEDLRGHLANEIQVLQNLGRRIAELDALACVAHLARSRRYCRPEITRDRQLHILEARHPVVEPILGEQFVPNDISFASDGPTLHIITGPNMAGKSTYIRQAALLVLMAQAGFYLPAKQATIGLVDRIFTRVGASDDLAAGQSTFMVEMTETANILLNSTAQSLVILDEVGRGTSTLDGLALAWAIAEYLADTTRCRTLFATHYHELTELAESSSAVCNLNVLVREWEDQILFMHRIVPGRADRSYGVQVARLAGVPRSVIQRARRLMDQLNVQVGKARPRAAATTVAGQVNLFDSSESQVAGRLAALDLNRMSPVQAWEAIKALQTLLTEKKALAGQKA